MGPAALAILLLVGTGSLMAGQTSPPQPSGSTLRDWNSPLQETARKKGPGQDLPQARQEYQIGAEDLIEISVFEVPEFSRVARVSASGEISLPLVGAVKAEGLSPMELEQVLAELLRRNYIKDPQVSVFLREYRSDPVSVMGAVKVPGLYQIQTQKSLVEILAMAQGFSEGPQMLPGRTIVITRKQSRKEISADLRAPQEEGPLRGAADAAVGAAGAEMLEIPTKELLQSGDPKWNVPIYPGDVVKVVPAGTFYVAGDVNQPGRFHLTEFDNVSTIQAVAMAGGTKKTASLKEALIIRRDAAGNRVEEKVDLKRVLQGKAADVKLGANDILFVPGSIGKEAALRAIEVSLQVAAEILIWGP